MSEQSQTEQFIETTAQKAITTTETAYTNGQVSEVTDTVKSIASGAESLITTVIDDSFDVADQIGDLVVEQISETAGEVKSVIQQTKDTLKKFEKANKTSEECQKEIEEVGTKLKESCEEISEAISALVKLPGDIMQFSCESVKGLFGNITDQLAQLPILSTSMTSSEYNAEHEDFFSNPFKYPKTMKAIDKLQESGKKITNAKIDKQLKEDGYKAIKWKPKIDMSKLQMTKLFESDTDYSIVADIAEKLLSETIKPQWDMIYEIIEPIGQFVPIDSLKKAFNAVVKGMDAVVQIATIAVPEEELDKYIKKQKQGEKDIQQDADNAKSMPNQAGLTASQLNNLRETQTQNMESQNQNDAASASGLFKNMLCNTLPEELKDLLKNLTDAFSTLASKLQNIILFIVIKVVGMIIEILAKIMQALGLGELPGLLGAFVKLINNLWNILCFIMELPQSLMKVVESIIKKKWKMMQIALTPIPPKPEPPKIKQIASSEDSQEMESKIGTPAQDAQKTMFETIDDIMSLF